MFSIMLRCGRALEEKTIAVTGQRAVPFYFTTFITPRISGFNTFNPDIIDGQVPEPNAPRFLFRPPEISE
jgi:hypothetical protein